MVLSQPGPPCQIAAALPATTDENPPIVPTRLLASCAMSRTGTHLNRSDDAAVEHVRERRTLLGPDRARPFLPLADTVLPQAEPVGQILLSQLQLDPAHLDAVADLPADVFVGGVRHGGFAVRARDLVSVWRVQYNRDGWAMS